MNNQRLKLQQILKEKPHVDFDIMAFALESFAKEVDYDAQNELLTKLILDQSSVAKRLEKLNLELSQSEEKLERYNQHLEQLVEEKVREISASQMATIFALIKLAESRDDDTGSHIERTASFCKLLANKARLFTKYSSEINDVFLETIYKASPLHDIGKVGIPDSILLKPGKLTDDEFLVMKSHVNIGFDTLAEVGSKYDKNDFLMMGMEIALYHHEKWDGSGYNKGLRGEEIPLSARIMAIADVYDALRSRRVYKEPFSHEKSVEIIIDSKGSHFDPLLVDVFIQSQDEFKNLYEGIK